MRKVLCFVVIILALFIVTACADNASQSDNPSQDEPKPIAEFNDTQPSESIVTATPKLTLSEDEKR